MLVDLNQEVLRFKLKDEKISLKLTPRNTIYKSKQAQDFYTYLRNGKAIIKADNNEVAIEDSTLNDLDVSCLEIDEVTAEYVGPELHHIAALAALPPSLPDTPLDVEFTSDATKDLSFAMTCELAHQLTG